MEKVTRKPIPPALSQGLAEITEIYQAPEKRCVERVDVQNAYPGVEIGRFGGSDRLFRVKTVAEYGAAFFHGGVDLRAEMGRDVETFLSLAEIQIPVISRLLYVTPMLAGVQFIDLSPGTRISIKSHFYLEYTAASMSPAPVPVPPPPSQAMLSAVRSAPPPPPAHQRVSWMKFGNEREHLLDIVAQGESPRSFKIDLGHSWATIEWQMGRSVLARMAVRQEITADQIRSQLVSFLRNLKGVNPKLLQQIGTIICSEDIDVVYPQAT